MFVLFFGQLAIVLPLVLTFAKHRGFLISALVFSLVSGIAYAIFGSRKGKETANSWGWIEHISCLLFLAAVYGVLAISIVSTLDVALKACASSFVIVVVCVCLYVFPRRLRWLPRVIQTLYFRLLLRMAIAGIVVGPTCLLWLPWH